MKQLGMKHAKICLSNYEIWIALFVTNYSNIWIIRIICPNTGPAPASATHASLQVYADLALVTRAHNRLEHHNQHHRISSRLTWCGFITSSWELFAQNKNPKRWYSSKESG